MTALSITLALAIAPIVWFLVERSRRETHPVEGGLHTDTTLPHATEFELYGNAFSYCSRKTRLLMAEIGIPYTHKPIDLIETGSYQTLSPEYLRINPSGLIPTLVHSGHPVYEFDDILAYAVAHARPGAPKLVPDDSERRARMQTWIDFCNLSSAETRPATWSIGLARACHRSRSRSSSRRSAPSPYTAFSSACSFTPTRSARSSSP